MCLPSANSEEYSSTSITAGVNISSYTIRLGNNDPYLLHSTVLKGKKVCTNLPKATILKNVSLGICPKGGEVQQTLDV